MLIRAMKLGCNAWVVMKVEAVPDTSGEEKDPGMMRISN
jgi:hypothetical protein